MALVAAMMLLMVSEVIARTVFSRPIPGATEWVQVMLVCCMTSLGASIMVGSMVEINMFTKRLKPVPQVVLDIIVLIITLIIVILIAIQQVRAGSRSMQNNVVWSSVRVPQWPFLFLFGFSYAVAAVVVLMTIIRKIIALAQGRAEEEVKLGSVDVPFAFTKYHMSMLPEEAFGMQKKDEPDAMPEVYDLPEEESEEVNDQ